MSTTPVPPAPSLSSFWLPLLICPLTHTPLTPDGDTLRAASGLRYPITHGIPQLVPEKAIPPAPYTTLEAFLTAWKQTNA